MPKQPRKKQIQKRQKMDDMYKIVSNYTMEQFLEQYNLYMKTKTAKEFAKDLGVTEYILRQFMKIKFGIVQQPGKPARLKPNPSL